MIVLDRLWFDKFAKSVIKKVCQIQEIGQSYWLVKKKQDT